MERKHTIAGLPEAKVAIRVRGMSKEHRFFDELTTTSRLTDEFVVIHLRELVDLDTEVHVTNHRTQIGGTFRVAWVNTRPRQGLHVLGLELLDPEGEIWEPDSVPNGDGAGAAPPVVVLECQYCRQQVATTIPEAETEALSEGFATARPCENCRATTPWLFQREKTADEALEEARRQADVTVVPEPAVPVSTGSIENRKKGRAPLQLDIKITRTKYGSTISDICKTINVSRTGVLFATEQTYEVGEDVQVVLPYHANSVAIAVPAKVVRQENTPDAYEPYMERVVFLRKRVALHLTPNAPSPSPASRTR